MRRDAKIELEKIYAYQRSRLFPWNFILEDVENAAIKHFLSYALQIKDMWRMGRLPDILNEGMKDIRGVIVREVRSIVDDYLFDPDDEDALRQHGKFAHSFPFAFSCCWVHIVLYQLGLRLEDVVDGKAVVELMGGDVRMLRRREIFINDLISALLKEKRIRRGVYGRAILNKKVVTMQNTYIGSVEDVIFDRETGFVEELIISKKSFIKKIHYIPLNMVRLNAYNGKFIVISLHS
ncbi:MAG: PRC-barrel domain-containing protein [Candidatus Methanospirareceae archaeon]